MQRSTQTRLVFVYGYWLCELLIFHQRMYAHQICVRCDDMTLVVLSGLPSPAHVD
jgi:hypothetical protein